LIQLHMISVLCVSVGGVTDMGGFWWIFEMVSKITRKFFYIETETSLNLES